MRQQRGLGVNQLARRASVSAAEVSRLERGQRAKANPLVLRKLADALDLPCEVLLERVGYLQPSAPVTDALAQKVRLLSADQRRMVELLIDALLAR